MDSRSVNGEPASPFRVRRYARQSLHDGTRDEVHPLSHWQAAPAYVLLAEPGAGKTESFKAEAEAAPDRLYVTARSLINLDPTPAVMGQTLFIDGLDEMRAGSTSRRDPLADICRRLNELGRPRFRIACREADWLGAVDQEMLREIAPAAGELHELHLEPISEEDILAILRQHPEGPADAQAFVAEATRKGVRALLGNPLLLDLMVKAVDGDRWPRSRAELFDRACCRLAVEYNPQHRAERRGAGPTVDTVLADAGLLAAALLISGAEGYLPPTATPLSARPSLDQLPEALGTTDPTAALSSKLFVSAGDLRAPVHRTIAEYLAARVIAARVERGLPVSRVLALMSGADGGIVEPLRGLHAWMAVHLPAERGSLIDRDPLGVVLYGDLFDFPAEDKRRILAALAREAEKFPWFRSGQWDANPFGALATVDMVPTFRELITAPDRSPAHQSLLDCVLDAIRYALEPAGMTPLVPLLKAMASDKDYSPGLRADAVRAWLALPGEHASAARALLDDIATGAVDDPDDDLKGVLLRRLYPIHVTPTEVMKYCVRPGTEFHYGAYRDFWQRRIHEATPSAGLAALLDGWTDASTRRSTEQWAEDDRIGIAGGLLRTAIPACGADVPVEKLYRWLGAGVDSHGAARLEESESGALSDWLSEHPEIQKALVSFGWRQESPGVDGKRRPLWKSEQRLFRARRPADWYRWLLDQAAATDDEELAHYCFDHAAHAALNNLPGFAIDVETVEDWVDAHQSKWPQAVTWREEAWSMPLDSWRQEQHRRKQEGEAQLDEGRQARRRYFGPHMQEIAAGAARPDLLQAIAFAYEERFFDVRGETPQARVQDLLGGSLDEARAAIAGLEAVLSRSDLPSVEQILALDRETRSHPISPACLIGAQLVHARDPAAPLHWPEKLAQRLVAFRLTEGLGEAPQWYTVLAARRPDDVAAVLAPYAVHRIRQQPGRHIEGLWPLANSPEQSALARAVLPGLLARFPRHANASQLGVLNQVLLRAAARHLDPRCLAKRIARRLALKSLDEGQRIAWLIAGLAADPERYTDPLIDYAGTSEARAVQIAASLMHQSTERRSPAPLPARALGRLVELIAPHASPEHPPGAGWVSEADQRRDLVNAFLNQLASQLSDEAGLELQRLRRVPALCGWKLAIDGAAFSQRRLARDANYSHPSIEAVAQTLAGHAPANSLDLAALLIEHLRALETRVRGDETNSLRLFYRDDASTPKIENLCRDVLQELLRPRLESLRIHLASETRAARDKRADLTATYMHAGERIAVPIEIKKEDNDGLWSAPRMQLKELYAIDSAAQGVGIYLALWFGIGVYKHPRGEQAGSPPELRRLLVEEVEAADRARLNVMVLDLSRPLDTKTRRTARR